MHIKHHYAATTLAVVFLVAMVALVASKYQFANNQVSSTAGVLSTYQNAQNALSNKASTLAQNVSTLSSKLTSSNATMQADANEIASLQSELSAAESKVSSLSTDAAAISSMNASLQMYKSFYASQISAISAQLTQIASLNSKISQLNNTANFNFNLLETSPVRANLTVPSSFDTVNPSFNNASMFTGSAYGNSELLVVGSKGNNFSTSNFSTVTAIAGFYNPSSKTLASINTSSLGKGIYLTAAAWNGSSFLVAALKYNTVSSTSGSPLLYSLSTTGKFNLLLNLTSYNFVIPGITWNGSSFVMVGDIEYADNSTSVLATYNQKSGFALVKTGIPSNISVMNNTANGLILNSISFDGTGYLVSGELANLGTLGTSGAAGPITVLSYSPSLSYIKKTATSAINFYTNEAATWDGSQLVIANAIPGRYTIGLFNPVTDSYVQTANFSDGVPGGISFNGSVIFVPGLINVTSAMLSVYS